MKNDIERPLGSQHDLSRGVRASAWCRRAWPYPGLMAFNVTMTNDCGSWPMHASSIPRRNKHLALNRLSSLPLGLTGDPPSMYLGMVFDTFAIFMLLSPKDSIT